MNLDVIPVDHGICTHQKRFASGSLVDRKVCREWAGYAIDILLEQIISRIVHRQRFLRRSFRRGNSFYECTPKALYERAGSVERTEVFLIAFQSSTTEAKKTQPHPVCGVRIGIEGRAAPFLTPFFDEEDSHIIHVSVFDQIIHTLRRLKCFGRQLRINVEIEADLELRRDRAHNPNLDIRIIPGQRVPEPFLLFWLGRYQIAVLCAVDERYFRKPEVAQSAGKFALLRDIPEKFHKPSAVPCSVRILK